MIHLPASVRVFVPYAHRYAAQLRWAAWKLVVYLCERLQHESSEKNKYRSLLRELLEAQRNRKSEQLSKEQLTLFEALWKASEPEAAWLLFAPGLLFLLLAGTG